MASNGLKPIVLKCTVCGFYWEPFGKSGFNVCTNCGVDWRYLKQVASFPPWLQRLRELEGENYLRNLEFARRY